jgi:small subunit ribosomal protein S20
VPVIKSAIKKLRRDRKREKDNDQFRSELEHAIKLAKKQKSQAAVTKAVSLIDKSVKKNLMHKNKAARVKSSISKLHKPTSAAKKTTKTAVKKSPSKASKK